MMNKITAKKLQPFANGFILLSIFLYGLETSLILNPVAIAFFVIFGLHLFVAKGAGKLIFPFLFILINMFMFLALFSELSEFSTFNQEALIMLSVGSFLLWTEYRKCCHHDTRQYHHLFSSGQRISW